MNRVKEIFSEEILVLTSLSNRDRGSVIERLGLAKIKFKDGKSLFSAIIIPIISMCIVPLHVGYNSIKNSIKSVKSDVILIKGLVFIPILIVSVIRIFISYVISLSGLYLIAGWFPKLFVNKKIPHDRKKATHAAEPVSKQSCIKIEDKWKGIVVKNNVTKGGVLIKSNINGVAGITIKSIEGESYGFQIKDIIIMCNGRYISFVEDFSRDMTAYETGKKMVAIRILRGGRSLLFHINFNKAK